MGNKNLKIRLGMAFDAEVIFERAVTIGEWSGLIIYGRHINGHFVCIPGEYAAEMSTPDDIFYNTEKLFVAGAPKWLAERIASAIEFIANEQNRKEAEQDEAYKKIKFEEILNSATACEPLGKKQ